MNEPAARPTALRRFVEDLRRRRVLRVAAVYVVIGWIIIEVSSTVLPPLQLPAWTVTLVIVLVALGFPLAVVMSWMFDLGPRGVQRTRARSDVDPDPSAADIATAAQPVLRAAAPPDDAKPLPATEGSRRTIAVLPFVNMSGDPANEYFSDGISEEILNLLTKLPQLKVASRTSSFYFKGKEIDIPMVAMKLHVDSVLEGSVRRSGNRVRITAQLIEVETDSNLWSETYDRELENVFAIQDDIASSIVNALKVTLNPKQRRSIQYVATANVQAYDDYLRGRKYFYAWNRRDSLRAIGMYQRAIAQDPVYAMAWAGLADAYSMRYRFLEADAAYAAKALEASEQALQLDPESAEAHASRGLALYINQRTAEAEQHFETAILISANAFEPYFLYGSCSSSQGDYLKATRLYIRAAEISPNDYLPMIYLAQAYSDMGRKDEEMQIRRRATVLIQQALDVNPHDARARYMGAANFATMGDRAKAIEWADLALRSSSDEPMVYYNAACTFAVLDENQRALELLERAVELGWGDRTWMESDSDLKTLRNNPRFCALLARLH
jgi:adenylate cyclase